MIGAVVLVLVAALLLAWLLKGKHREGQEMANQTADSTPIIGFPGVGGEQKPQLVNEDPNAAAPQNPAGAGQAAQGQATQGTGLIPSVDLKLPEGSVANTTGFDLRPAGGEVRTVVDTDNKVKEGTGNMGTGDAKAPAGTAGGTTEAATPAPADGAPVTIPATPQAEPRHATAPGSAMQDKPVDTKATEAPVEKKPASRVVVVNEKPVPAAASVESASSRKAAEAKAKETAARQAAEKAAAEKSMKLAAEKTAAEKAKASGGAAAAGDGFAIQVMASSDKAKADALARSLATDGNKAVVAETKVDGKVFYRVRISGYKNRDEAVAAQAKLKARYTQNQYVQNSFVTK
jgi:cell division protein FtsN